MKSEQKVVIFSVVFLLLLFALGTNIYKNIQNSSIDTTVLMKKHSITLGNPNAKVKLVEFFDPACGTCAQFYPLVKDLMKKHDGKIQLTLRYAPFHKNSQEIIKILEAARAQDMFWETLELLFMSQAYWIENHEVNPKIAWKIIEKLWLDMDKMKKDAKEPHVELRIKEDLEDAKKLHVTKTPSYFVNAKPLEKFGYEELVRLVESEL